jgi:hypothetical protein
VWRVTYHRLYAPGSAFQSGWLLQIVRKDKSLVTLAQGTNEHTHYITTNVSALFLTVLLRPCCTGVVHCGTLMHYVSQYSKLLALCTNVTPACAYTFTSVLYVIRTRGRLLGRACSTS